MELEKRLNTLKNSIGLVGGPLILRKLSDAPYHIRAGIDPKDWHIEISVAVNWNPVQDRRTREYANKKNITDPLWAVLRDIEIHECGHWAIPRGSKSGCPRSSVLHDTILDAAGTALEKSGKSKGHASYVANTFEDILSNTFCRQHTSHTGQVLFYNDQGLYNAKNQVFSPFYEAFVRLNMFCWGDNFDEKLLKRFYSMQNLVNSTIAQVISDIGLKQKSALFVNSSANSLRPITYLDMEKIASDFLDEQQWYGYAFSYTTAMAKLLEGQPPVESLFGAGGDSASNEGNNYDNNNSSGSGSKNSKGESSKDNPKDKDKGIGKDKNKNSSSSSAFDEKLKGDKDTVVLARFKAGKSKASYMDSFEYLDSLYKSLCRQIPLKVELFSESHNFPVAHYGSRQFNPDSDDFAKLKLSSLGISESGKICFVTHRGDITIPAQHTKNLKGFPSLKVINLDTSGSMKEPLSGRDSGMPVNPFAPEKQQWGDKSKYHYALIGKYGIDAYLDMQGISGEVDSILINFSGEAIIGKRQPFNRRKEENRLALTPQFGGTCLDINKLKTVFGSDDFFAITLSDGEFSNWSENREKYIQMVSGHAYAHIQVGAPNTFTKDLQDAGLQVYFVNKDNPLDKLMVDITQKHYQKFAIEAIRNGN